MLKLCVWALAKCVALCALGGVCASALFDILI